MLNRKLFRKKEIGRGAAVIACAGTVLFCSLDAGRTWTLFASATENTESASEEEAEEETSATSAKVMSKTLGATSFWRWSKCTGSIDKTADDWDRYMMIETYGTEGQDNTEYNYIAGKGVENCYFSSNPYGRWNHNAANIGSNNHWIADIDTLWGSGWKNRINWFDRVDNYNTDFVIVPDRARNYKSKDPMIKPDRNVFFTDDDRDVPYVRYTNARSFGEFDLALAESAQSKKYYVHVGEHETGDSEDNRGFLIVSPEEEKHNGVQINGNGVSGEYIIRSTEYSSHQTQYQMDICDGAVCGRYRRYNWSQRQCAFWFYKGEEWHFSTLDGTTTVPENMVFNISAGSFTDAKGKNRTTKGVLIENGAKLVIDGGVVSVKGNLINNGTIEIKNGGVLLIQDGATISSFLQGKNSFENGCGKIMCTGGDIIIEKGGAVYAGLNDANGLSVAFSLDKGSTLINCGLLVYGSMKLGDSTRVELRNGSKTIGSIYEAKDVEAKLIDNETAVSDSTRKEKLKALKEKYPDTKKYRIDEVRALLTTMYQVYEYKPTAKKVADMDYDLLSQYNDAILKAESGIPESCKGLYKNYEGGMDFNSDNVTILRYTKSYFEDNGTFAADKEKYMKDYEGL